MFEQCHCAKKGKRRTVHDFFTLIVLQIIETNEEKTPLAESKKIQKEHYADKNQVKKAKRAILCFQGSGGQRFCFERGFGVSSMF